MSAEFDLHLSCTKIWQKLARRWPVTLCFALCLQSSATVLGKTVTAAHESIPIRIFRLFSDACLDPISCTRVPRLAALEAFPFESFLAFHPFPAPLPSPFFGQSPLFGPFDLPLPPPFRLLRHSDARWPFFAQNQQVILEFFHYLECERIVLGKGAKVLIRESAQGSCPPRHGRR